MVKPKYQKPIIIGAVIVIIAVLAILLWIKINNKGGSSISPALITTTPDDLQQEYRTGTLSLQGTVSTLNYKVSDTASFNIMVDDIGKYIIAVDAIVDYNSQSIKIVNITPSSAFDAYPLASINNNKISISAIMKPGHKILGPQRLATVTVQFLSKGTANFSLEFKPGATVDSNVMTNGSITDDLGKVNNISFNIQ